MQTCSICNALSPDEAKYCSNCDAVLSEFSTTAAARKRFQANSRVKTVRVSVMHNACPACNEIEGVYDKDGLPALPVEGCSHKDGCRCFYQPVLDVIYP